MPGARFEVHRHAARLLAMASLLAGAQAFGSMGAHYEGQSQDRSQFRLYLDGGEFLGARASLQSIRVTVHRLRQGRPSQTIQDCVYLQDLRDHRKDRIECAARSNGPLSGVVYVRDTRPDRAQRDAVEPMVCVQRCSSQVPRRLRLDAEDDNG